jgi:hypothetical protein
MLSYICNNSLSREPKNGRYGINVYRYRSKGAFSRGTLVATLVSLALDSKS